MSQLMSCPIEGPHRSVSKPSFFFVFVDLDPRSTDLRIYISMDLSRACMSQPKASTRASVINSKHHEQCGTPRYVGPFIILVSANRRKSAPRDTDSSRTLSYRFRIHARLLRLRLNDNGAQMAVYQDRISPSSFLSVVIVSAITISRESGGGNLYHRPRSRYSAK
jgi:hypothetical protein